MYRLNNESGTHRTVPPKPILAAKRRRQLYPFFFSMGPVALSISSVLLVALMAVLYLTQFGQAVAANQQLQDIHTQQSILDRQNQDLVNTISREQSPGYIAAQAKAQGLVPADSKAIQIIVIKHLKPIPDDTQNIQP